MRKGTILCYHQLEEKQQIIPCLEGFAGIVASEQAYTVAAKLYGVAEALRTTIGLANEVREEHMHFLAQARAQLDAFSWESAWAEGLAMSLDQAIELVLTYDSQVEGRQQMVNNH